MYRELTISPGTDRPPLAGAGTATHDRRVITKRDRTATRTGERAPYGTWRQAAPVVALAVLVACVSSAPSAAADGQPPPPPRSTRVAFLDWVLDGAGAAALVGLRDQPGASAARAALARITPTGGEPVLVDGPLPDAGVTLSRRLDSPVPARSRAELAFYDAGHDVWTPVPTRLSADRATLTATVHRSAYWTDLVTGTAHDAVRASDLLSAPVPAQCRHPAGRLQGGRLPIAPDDSGYGLLELAHPAPVFADLTGDRVGDAAAVYHCTAGGVTWPDTVLFYGPGPTLLGAAPLVDVTQTEHSDVTALAADGADVVVRWHSYDGCCFDPSDWTARLHWDGRAVRILDAVQA
jgi:hypothetical protein